MTKTRQDQNSESLQDQGKKVHAEIYGLYDNHGNLRYIGKANNSVKRLKTHFSDARRRKTPVYCWINSMLANGLMPQMKVLKITDQDSWAIDEKTLIFEARLRGERLLNLADGGDQPKCPIEVRRANGAKNAKMWSELPHWRMAINQLTQGIKFYEDRGNHEKAEKCLMALAKLKHLTKEQKIAVNEQMRARSQERKQWHVKREEVPQSH